jgi:hypothetical protein
VAVIILFRNINNVLSRALVLFTVCSDDTCVKSEVHANGSIKPIANLYLSGKTINFACLLPSCATGEQNTEFKLNIVK